MDLWSEHANSDDEENVVANGQAAFYHLAFPDDEVHYLQCAVQSFLCILFIMYIYFPRAQCFPDEPGTANGHRTPTPPPPEHNGTAAVHNGSGGGHALSNGGLQSEVVRLANENLVLQNKVNAQADAVKQMRRIRADGGNDSTLDSLGDGEVVHVTPVKGAALRDNSALVETFNLDDFIRLLITDLSPRLARLLSPDACVPSYLLLMALRLHDRAGDEAAMSAAFSSAHHALRRVAQRCNDLDVLSLWLANAARLHDLLRQYSTANASGGGDDECHVRNTARQNEHRLQRFDTAPLREKIGARARDLYEALVKRAVEPVLMAKLAPALLHHSEIDASHSATAASGSGGNVANGHGELRQAHSYEQALDDLLHFMDFLHGRLRDFAASPPLRLQVMQHCARQACAVALNQLVMRRDMCNFERAVQIKHNAQLVQNWLAHTDRLYSDLRQCLEPLVQACHLLQTPKDQVDLLCGDMTSELSCDQVCSLLAHYSPVEIALEQGAVPPETIDAVRQRLQMERPRATAEHMGYRAQGLLMSTHLKPLELDHFTYCPVRLETVQMPKMLHMTDVARVL